MISMASGGGASSRDVLFRLRLLADPDSKKAADETISQTKRVQDAIEAANKAKVTSQTQAAKAEEQSLRAIAAAHLAAMGRQRQHVAEDAALKRQQEQSARQLAAAQLQSLKEVSEAQQKAAETAKASSWKMAEAFGGRGGVLHGVVAVATGFKHLGLASEENLKKLVQGIEQIRGVEHILHGSLQIVGGLANAWQSVATSAAAAQAAQETAAGVRGVSAIAGGASAAAGAAGGGVSAVGPGLLAIGSAAMGAAAPLLAAAAALTSVGLVAAEIVELNQKVRSEGGVKFNDDGDIESGGARRGGVRGWIQRNAWATREEGAAGATEAYTADKVDATLKLRHAIEMQTAERGERLAPYLEDARRADELKERRALRIPHGRLDDDDYQLGMAQQGMNRFRTSRDLASSQYNDLSGRQGKGLIVSNEELKDADDRRLHASEMMFEMAQKMGQIEEKKAVTSVEAARKTLELREKETEKLSEQIKMKEEEFNRERESRMSAVERFRELNPVKQKQVSDAIRDLQHGGQLSAKQLKLIRPYEDFLGEDATKQRFSDDERFIQQRGFGDIFHASRKENAAAAATTKAAGQIVVNIAQSLTAGAEYARAGLHETYIKEVVERHMANAQKELDAAEDTSDKHRIERGHRETHEGQASGATVPQ